MKEKVVLAYSGGLDTTAIIPWLKEQFDYDVVCCCIDCGQGNELDGLDERAQLSGASKLYIEDVVDEFCEDFIMPCVQAGAVYENKYLLLETKIANINKESIAISSDMIPVVFRLVDELKLPVDEFDSARVDQLNEMFKSMASRDTMVPSVDDLFRVLLPEKSVREVELVLSRDEEVDKNSIFSCAESDEPKDRCLNYKISSITVDGKTYLTTGSIFIMNDDGKTIDRV